MTTAVVAIDDDPVILDMYEQLLSSGGYPFATASNGLEGWEKIRTLNPDVILTDWSMPVMGGAELLAEVKSHPMHSSTHVIVVTGINDAKTKMEGFAAGADDHLNKPFDKVELLARVRTGLRIRRLQKSLAREVHILSEAIQQSPLSMVITDVEGNIKYVNPRYTRMTGFEAGEMIGKNIGGLKMMKIADARTEEVSVLDMVRQKNGFDGELCSYRKDGTVIWERVHASPISNAEGKVSHYLFTREDISGRKNADDKMRILSLAVQQSPASIIITDSNGVIKYVNPKFCDVTGYSEEEAVGRTPGILKSGEISTEQYKNIWEVLLSGREWRGKFRNKKKNGEFYWENANVSPVKNADGITTHYLAVKEDITELVAEEERRRQLENQLVQRNTELEKGITDLTQMQTLLVQSEKMASIGQLTAGIAHEINNPLAFVSSNLNRFKEYFDETFFILRKWQELGEKLEEEGSNAGTLQEIRSLEKQADLPFISSDFESLMQHTREGTERIKSIVEKLRGFVHSSGSELCDADINNALDETITLVWNELKYKATIRKEYGNLPPVHCNIGEIKQVLVNLLVNASHALQEPGTICLRTSREEDSAIIQVEDTGCGIKPEYLRKIFDPFFTTKPVGKGTGLGLWISATIIQNHNGTLTVNSEPGKGSTFMIRLPLRTSGKSDKTWQT